MTRVSLSEASPTLQWNLPSHWELLRNKHLLVERNALSAEGVEVLLTVSHLTGITPRAEKSVNMFEAESLVGYRIVKPGDLVINTMWAWMGALGVSNRDGIVSPAYGVYQAVPDAPFDPWYFNYLYRSQRYVDVITNHSRGIWSSRLRLYPDVFLGLNVPVPPLNEQRAIADYLDRETAQIDKLIAKQRQLIATLLERRAAVVEDALEPSGRCTLMALKFALDGVDQGVSPQAEAGLADEPGTWGVLKSGAVNHGVFRQEQHKRLPAAFGFDPKIAVVVGDVIVSRASGSSDLVGSCGVVKRLDYQLILSDKLFRLRPAVGTDPSFLTWQLNGRRYRTQVRQSISGAEGLANNLPLRALLSFEVAMPPVDEQSRIAAYLDEQTAKIDALIAKTERFIELSKERRAALITATVTGQIYLRAA